MPDWIWTPGIRRKDGQPYLEGRSPTLECMIHWSGYRRGLTSTTFWRPGENWFGDHFLNGERTQSLEDARAFVEANTDAELLRRSTPRADKPRAGAQRPVQPAQARKRPEIPIQLCAVCGAPGAPFGYGPPLVAQVVWACRGHRDQVDPAALALPDWLKD